MELRELGGTGVMVPEIGLGTWRYRGGVAPLQRAIELGAWLIDTAEVYGTEDVVGEAIRGLREKVFLATKVSGDHLGYGDVLKAAESSLKRLGTDTIDLYQVHWPDTTVPIGDTMRAMEKLADEGKVRFIGVSNFSRQQVEEAQAALTKHRIVSNQVEYSLAQREPEADFASFYEPQKISIIAYSPLAQGELLFSSMFPGVNTLQRIAHEAGKTPAQVALNWCLSRSCVIAIPKTDKVERVDEDVAASGWSLTPDQIAALDEAFPVE